MAWAIGASQPDDWAIGASQPTAAGVTKSLAGSTAAVCSVSSGLVRSVQLASDVEVGAVGWIGINSSHYDSHCGDFGSYTIEKALNGTDAWYHMVAEVHNVVLDLGQVYNVKKVRGRSNLTYDPTSVNIYVSNDKESWGAAVASGIDTWQNTNEWQEVDTVYKSGRYVKVEIAETEAGVSDVLMFGSDAPFEIFDVYGSLVTNLTVGQASVNSGLLLTQQLSAAVSALCSTSASLSTPTIIELAATVSANASASAQLQLTKLMSGTSSGTVSTSAALRTLIQIAASVATQSSASASVRMLTQMSAIIVAESGVSAALCILRPLAAAIAAKSTITARMIIDGVASGIDEAVRNEFQFPYIPETIQDDVKRVLVELRTMLEQQLIGNFHIGGDLHTDGAYFGQFIRGAISGHDVNDDIALAAQDTFYQITSFDTNCNSDHTTPDHTQDHIEIEKSGDYAVSLSMSGHSGASNNYELWVRKNNGVTGFDCLVIHQTTAVADRIDSSSVTAQISLSAGDTLEAWVKRLDGGAVEKTFTVDHVDLSVTLVGI